MLCVGIFKSPWMVVAACFVLQIYSVGSEYTFGLLNIQILNEFDMSTSEVAWIGSIQMAVFFFTGLLVMPFKALLGWTRINIIGCVLITAGIVSTYYCTIPHLLYLTYGLLVGSGTGIHYFVATVRIQEVFGDNRALANGIASSGGGVGVILISILRESTFHIYGWREGLLLELVFIPLCLLCIGMLYIYERTAQDEDTISILKTDINPSNGIQSNGYNSEATLTTVDQDLHGSSGMGSDELDQEGDKDETLRKPVQHLHLSSGLGSDCPYEECSEESSLIQSNQSLHFSYSMQSNFLHKEANSVESFQTSLGSESLKKIFGDPMLYLTLVVAFLITNGMFAPSAYLPQRSEIDLGLNSSQSAQQVLCLGVINIPARIVSGYVGAHSLEARFLFFVLVNLLSGVMTTLMFLYTTYAQLMVYAAVIGLVSGTYAALMPVLVVDIFGKENLHIPMSFYLSSMALSLLLGYPFLGWLAEISQTCVNTFIAIGVLQLSAVFVCFIVGCIKYRRLKQAV